MATLIFVSGWFGVALVGAAVLLPVLAHAAQRRWPPRRVLRCHYLLGWPGVAVVVTHGVASVSSGSLPVPYVVGLWAGAAALWLVCLVVAIGVGVMAQRGAARLRSRRLHVLLTPPVVALAVAHIALNWQLVVLPR